jgi:thiol-disulfide isomerase/thioredoxin
MYIGTFSLFSFLNVIYNELVEDFDSKLKESADTLIVIDYSTTWCGPCKMVFPKYEGWLLIYTCSTYIENSYT